MENLIKKVLLLDTSFSAKPIYDALVKSGFEIYVIGGNPNDSLAKSVQNYIDADYSKVENVISIIESQHIKFIAPGGNDLSYKVCSEINTDNRFCNIDSIAVNETINKKEKFREFAFANNLHVPKLILPNAIEQNLPVIVKPVDAFSGHGMTVLFEFDKTNIKKAVDKAVQNSNSKKYLIEEYVSGQLYSHSAFIRDGKIMIDFVVKEFCIVNPYVVDTSHMVYNFDQEILEQIRLDIEIMAQKLLLVDGLVHTQFILNDSSFWLIEVTRRCPGDLYSKLIELSTGFPYAQYYANPFIDITNNHYKRKLKKKHIIRHTITLSQNGIFNSLDFVDDIILKKYVPLAITGDRLQESPFSRIGIAFFQANTKSAFNALVKKTIARELYTVN